MFNGLIKLIKAGFSALTPLSLNPLALSEEAGKANRVRSEPKTHARAVEKINAMEKNLRDAETEMTDIFSGIVRALIATPLSDSNAVYRQAAEVYANLNIFAKGVSRRKGIDKRVLKRALEPLTKKDVEALVARYREVGLLDSLLSKMGDKNLPLPVSFTHKVAQAINDGHKSEARRRVFSGHGKPARHEKSGQVSADAVETGIKIIDIVNLLPDGKPEPQKSGAEHKRLAPEESAEDELRIQLRFEWIEDLLSNKGIKPSDCKLYRNKPIDGPKHIAGKYMVLEVKNADHFFQIAFTEEVGYATLTLRKPVDFENGENTTIADLREDPTTFRTTCYTPAQFQRSISKYAFTPLTELSAQLKTKIYWSDKAEAVKQTFGEFFLDTFQRPKSYDDSIIEHGPLAGKTTYRRLYIALNMQSIKGLEHVRNFKKLQEEVFGPDCKVSRLEQKAPSSPKFDAAIVFADALLDAKKTKELPQLEEAFGAALKAGRVKNLHWWTDTPERVTSKEAFLLVTGIAEERDGELVIAPPAVIHDMVRELQ